MLTRKDLTRIYDTVSHCKIGYCCHQKCDNKLIKLGYNYGYYGWNWSLFYDGKEDTLYISYYRNVPEYIKEK